MSTHGAHGTPGTTDTLGANAEDAEDTGDTGDGGDGGGGLTVRSALPRVLRPSSSPDQPLRRPTHAHRLDRATSGLLVAAKTRPALRSVPV